MAEVSPGQRNILNAIPSAGARDGRGRVGGELRRQRLRLPRWGCTAQARRRLGGWGCAAAREVRRRRDGWHSSGGQAQWGGAAWELRAAAAGGTARWRGLGRRGTGGTLDELQKPTPGCGTFSQAPQAAPNNTGAGSLVAQSPTTLELQRRVHNPRQQAHSTQTTCLAAAGGGMQGRAPRQLRRRGRWRRLVVQLRLAGVQASVSGGGGEGSQWRTRVRRDGAVGGRGGGEMVRVAGTAGASGD